MTDRQDDLVQLLRELLAIYKAVNRPLIADRLEKELSNEVDRKIYQASDGQHSVREVARLVGDISHSSVYSRWTKWQRAGLVERTATGRVRRLFDLGDYGLSPAADTGDGDNHAQATDNG